MQKKKCFDNNCPWPKKIFRKLVPFLQTKNIIFDYVQVGRAVSFNQFVKSKIACDLDPGSHTLHWGRFILYHITGMTPDLQCIFGNHLKPGLSRPVAVFKKILLQV